MSARRSELDRSGDGATAHLRALRPIVRGAHGLAAQLVREVEVVLLLRRLEHRDCRRARAGSRSRPGSPRAARPRPAAHRRMHAVAEPFTCGTTSNHRLAAKTLVASMLRRGHVLLGLSVSGEPLQARSCYAILSICYLLVGRHAPQKVRGKRFHS